MVLTCPPFKFSSKGGFSLRTVKQTRPVSPSRRETIIIYPEPRQEFYPRTHSGISNGSTITPITNNRISVDTSTPSPQPHNGNISSEKSSIHISSEKSSIQNDTNPPSRSSIKKVSDASENDLPNRKSSAGLGRKTISEILGLDPKKRIEKRRPAIPPLAHVDTSDLNYEKYEKDQRTATQISKAIMTNDFLKNLMDDERLTCVVEAMSPQEYPPGSLIIREGESGSHLYVSAYGQFEVLKGGQVVKTFGPGEAFGELALLFKAKRFASIRCIGGAKVWVLERKVFQKIMVRSGRREQEDNVRFLSSVPLLQEVPPSELVKISGFLKREFFSTGTAVVRQGDRGDKFYIIRGGTVSVTKRDGDSEHRVATLRRGDYFGEQALLHEDRRLATVTALAPGVECLTLERGPFIEFLGGLDQLLQKRHEKPAPILPHKKSLVKSEFEYVELKDLEIVGTLGVGGFGRVELVRYKKDKTLTFALKCLKKIEMVQQQQQEHAFNEKSIMMICDSPFLCKLYRTYKDTKYIYFLMEPVLGGDVWTILQKQRCFADNVARFMAACVVEAFQYLHAKNIIYRDLKPENLMLDKYGYIKLVDFGFAKLMSPNSKTWTFAGTPEYVAPEIVLAKGHDRAVDCWALGVFIHELLVGKPPFRAPGNDHMKTYSLILRGIDLISWHPRISNAAKTVIRKLCRNLPGERLGYLKNGMDDVKAQKWFLGFDWEGLRERKLKPPLIQPVANDWDLSNFEKYPKDKTPPDETSGWDIDF